MPDVPKNEKKTPVNRAKYLKKCIPIVHKENPGLSMNAVIGKCEGMYDSSWRSKKAKGSLDPESEIFWESENESGPFIITS